MSVPPYVASALTIAETFRSSVKTFVHVAENRFGRAHPDPVAQSSERILEWATRLVARTDSDLHVHGLEHMVRGERYLVLTNHQSHYDIPFLFVALGGEMRMLAKQELFDVPLFGPAIRASGFIPIDRRDRTKALASLEELQRTVAAGLHVWMAPEGSRSVDGTLQPFKKGAFHLAIGGKLPVLPVTLRGTGKVLPARSFRTQPGLRVDITVHAPIRRTELAPDDDKAREELMVRVREALQRGL